MLPDRSFYFIDDVMALEISLILCESNSIMISHLNMNFCFKNCKFNNICPEIN